MLTESYRWAPASLVAPFDYTSMLWALVLGYLAFGEFPTALGFLGAAIIVGAGLFVIWRERQLQAERAGGGRSGRGQPSFVPITSMLSRARTRDPAVETNRGTTRVALASCAGHASPLIAHAAFVHCEMTGRSCAGTAAGRAPAQRPKALKVMMVRVSWMPAMVCTFSLTKCPMSVPSST